MKHKVKNVQEILTSLPNKRYFSIGETSEACGVKPYVLRYWEQEFPQLSPLKRNQRRYYRSEDIEIIALIRNLLHVKRFTIQGARKYISGQNTNKQNKTKGSPAEKMTTISQSTLFDSVMQIVQRVDRVIERLEKISAY